MKIQMISSPKCLERIYKIGRKAKRKKIKGKYMRMIMEETRNLIGQDLSHGKEREEQVWMVLLPMKQIFQTIALIFTLF